MQSQGKQLQTEVLVGGADSFWGQGEPYPFNTKTKEVQWAGLA